MSTRLMHRILIKQENQSAVHIGSVLFNVNCVQSQLSQCSIQKKPTTFFSEIARINLQVSEDYPRKHSWYTLADIL